MTLHIARAGMLYVATFTLPPDGPDHHVGPMLAADVVRALEARGFDRAEIDEAFGGADTDEPAPAPR